MKIKYFTLLFTLAIIATACSKEDNYSSPNAGLYGGIYDLSTKESDSKKLIPSQSPQGARIRLYEGTSSQSLNFWCKPDGSFENTEVFKGFYRIIPEGPFIVTESDTVRAEISSRENVNFFVEPFLRISLEGELNEATKSIHYKFKINKSDQWSGRLEQYMILYSWTQFVDPTSYSKAKRITLSKDEESSVLNVDLEDMLDGVDINKPIFIRIAAKTANTNYYNYSETIRLK